jgi:hypothetical protein
VSKSVRIDQLAKEFASHIKKSGFVVELTLEYKSLLDKTKTYKTTITQDFYMHTVKHISSTPPTEISG